MKPRALDFDNPFMLAAARGRLSSVKWRVGQGALFAIAGALALHAPWAACAWLVCLCGSIGFEFSSGRRYLQAKGSQERRTSGAVFVAICGLTIAIYATMMIGLAINGEGPGQLVSLLMAASLLISIIIFLGQAPAFAAISATACVAGLAAITSAQDWRSAVDGVVPVALGVAAFLGYSWRSAVVNARMLADLEAARETAEAKQAEAEAANRAKSEFLTTMTHELRTPLNAVIGYAELIAEDMDAEGHSETSQDARRIHAAACNLLAMIDHILQLAETDSTRSLNLADVNLAKIIDGVVTALADQIGASKNRLTVRVAPDAGSAYTDPEKLSLCLLQLVGNAAKFTSNGEIGIEVARDGAHFRISVSDTGVGMSPEQLSAAFLPFTQADGSMTRTQGGAGIGLALARRLANLLGGDIAVVSEPGAGSIFTLFAPLHLRKEQPSLVA